LIDRQKKYHLDEAVKLIKQSSKVKFDASVEVHINLGIDPKKSDQLIRSSVNLPHGSGKTVRVAAFVADDKKDEAEAAGADLVGSDDLIDKIKETGKCDFDIAVATPAMMKKLAVIARVLGQKGLMPSPKTGTITPDPAAVIKELKQGKMSFKNDTSGNLHIVCGKVSFDDKKLIANIEALLDLIKKIKPESLKGTFIKGVHLSSSMGPSVKVEV